MNDRPTPAETVERAVADLGAAELLDRCAGVLGGQGGLGGEGGLELGRRLSDFDDEWLTRPANRYWPRVWAARALLYVWRDDLVGAVVTGASDEHWRVREMCLKVAVHRELSDLVPAAADAAGDDTPRVRAAAARVLGELGEAEAAEPLHALSQDDDRGVQVTADRALTRLRERLDREL